jgi:hypothetical protein
MLIVGAEPRRKSFGGAKGDQATLREDDDKKDPVVETPNRDGTVGAFAISALEFAPSCQL